MSSSYYGDTSAKCLGRGLVWTTIPLYSWFRILAITGPKAGDLLAARALGVPEVNMVGVDLNQTFINQSREIVPGARLYHGDVEKITENIGPFDVMFLDFCGHIDTCVPIWVRCAKAVTQGGVIVIGISYGRDGRQSKKDESAAADRFYYLLDVAKPLFQAQGLTFIPNSPTPWIGYQGGEKGTTPMLYVFGTVESGKEGVRFPERTLGLGVWINRKTARANLHKEAIQCLKNGMSQKEVLDLFSLEKKYLQDLMVTDAPGLFLPDKERDLLENRPFDKEVVFNYIQAQKSRGAIWDEVERDTPIRQWQVMADLKDEGRIIGTGEKRRTRKGTWAKVAAAVENVLARPLLDSGSVEDFLDLVDKDEDAPYPV